MSFLDDAKKKLGRAVDQHGDKISTGIDKAAQAADKKTGGKHHDKIANATGKAKDALDKLDGRNDDLPDDPSRPPGTPPSSTPPSSTPPSGR